MILLDNYKDVLDYYANTPANMVDKQQYKYDAGTSFELDINDTIIKNSNDTDVSFLFKDKNNMFTIDHMIVTPYAVFILEAKNHKAQTKYKSELHKWHIINEKKIINIINNPVLQVLKYKTVVSTFMSYYKINLPIIPKVIFKQQVNLDDITDNEKKLCIYPCDLSKLIHTSKKDNIFQPNEALKFAKILFYYGCHPIAYDDNKINWSVSK